MKISKLTAAVLAASSIALAQAGGLQDKMDAHFNAMRAASPDQNPALEQMTGTFSGGNPYEQTPGIVPEAVTQPLPSTDAGCGTINMFTDAYDYVNDQQFVDIQQKIASEAKGYAFNIALDVACSQCMSWINALQSKVQNLNQNSVSNCRLSQGIVTDSPSAFNAQRANDYSVAGAVSGLYSSYFAASTQLDGRDLRTELDTNHTAKSAEIIGNIVWQELKRHAVKDWVVDPAADEAQEYGLLMSFTGSIIIPSAAADAANPATGSTNLPIYLPATIGFKDLIEGGTLNVYSCGATDTLCLTPTVSGTAVTGMAERIYNVLDGLALRMRTEGAAQMTAEELNLISNMPQPVGVMVKNLSVTSLRTARQLSRDISYAMAMTMAYDTLSENLSALETAVRSSTKPEAKIVVDMIRERRRTLAEDYTAYARTHKTTAQILEQYNDIMKNTQLLSVEIARLGTAGNR